MKSSATAERHYQRRPRPSLGRRGVRGRGRLPAAANPLVRLTRTVLGHRN